MNERINCEPDFCSTDRLHFLSGAALLGQIGLYFEKL